MAYKLTIILHDGTQIEQVLKDATREIDALYESAWLRLTGLKDQGITGDKIKDIKYEVMK